MKKIIFTVLLLLSGLITYSQSMYKSYSVVAVDSDISVPRYLVGFNDNSKPDTLGIVFTLKQAQIIDNDLELLDVYRSMHKDCDSTVSFLVRVVDDYKHLNVLAQARFKAYDEAIIDQKKQINNLKQQISVKEGQILTQKDIISDKDKIIGIDKKQIKHLQSQKSWLIGGGGAILAGLVYMLIGHPGIK